ERNREAPGGLPPARAGEALTQPRRGAGAEPERLGHARAEPFRDALGDVLLLRVIDDLLGLDDLASDVVDAPQAVREAELDRFRARPDQAAEQVRRFLQPLATALADDVDELLVDLAEQLLRLGHLPRLERRERVEKRLVLPRSEDPSLDAELLHGVDE